MGGVVWGIAVVSIILTGGYVGLCIWLVRGWRSLPAWRIPEAFAPRVSISVLIPARNEAACIQACVQSVLEQDYPPELLELIVIDDHSEDETAAIVESMAAPNLHLLRLREHILPGETQSYKKKAIETGIAHARGALIVTTDADCIAPPQWLRAVASRYACGDVQCILGPVGHSGERSALERFQSLDMAGLMLCAGALAHQGIPLLANGANLAYAKAAFEAVGGFEDIDHLASGDDLMLVHKIAARFPGQVAFLKSAPATVRTPAQPDWPSFWQQRIRWATKTNHYRRPGMTAVLAGIFLLCVSVPVMLLGSVWFGTGAAGLALAVLFAKGTADYLLLREACRFFGRPDLLRGFPRSELLHVAYMTGAGVLGNVVKRYEWKGREVR